MCSQHLVGSPQGTDNYLVTNPNSAWKHRSMYRRFAQPLLCHACWVMMLWLCVYSRCFFKWDVLLFISGQKSGCLCACIISTAKQILIINHRNRKVVGGTHNVLIHDVDDFLPNLSGVVHWNPFIWVLCWSFLIKILLLFFLPQQWNEFQNIPISAGRCLLHWNTNQPSPYYFC